MLSIGKLGAGQQRYYLDKIAAGADDYYPVRRGCPDLCGTSAAIPRLGSHGTVGFISPQTWPIHIFA